LIPGETEEPEAEGPGTTPSPTAAGGPGVGATPPQDRRTRTDRRAEPDRRRKNVPVAVDRRAGADRRRETDRRDPQRRGGQYELDAETLEFIRAVGDYKDRTGKAFPTWSDILGILRSLGYEKRPR
jgi:hypothetical protein